jgi:DNA end-binding protein Ku
VVKGYEVAADEWVVLDKEEVDAAQGERSKLIELEEFVPGGEIDPVFYDKSYYLGVGKDGDEAYRLLHAALERTERVALGRFTFHNREYLAAVRPLDGGVLVLHTMRFADELVDADDLDLPEASRKPSKKEADMAGRLVEGLQADFAPEQYEDSYREAVLDVIKRKGKGEEIEPAAAEEPDEGADLMAALEASIGDGKGGGKRSRSKSKSTSKSKPKSKKAKAKS